MSEVSAKQVAMAVEHAKIRDKMREFLSPAQIEMIETAITEPRELADGRTIDSLRLVGFSCHGVKKGDERQDIMALRHYDLIRTGGDGEWYWLSRDGRTWYESLKRTSPDDATLSKRKSKKREYVSPLSRIKANQQKLGSLNDLRQMSFKQLKAFFDTLQITEFGINTLMSAKHHVGDRWVVESSKPCEVWPDSPVACDQRLMDYGLMYQNLNLYYLTTLGVRVRQIIQDSKGYAEKGALDKLIDEPARTEQAMDINWNRDGVFSTIGKLWYVWTHGEEIKQRALQRQYAEFIEGQKLIEDAATLIATSDQRVARQLIEKPIVAEPNEFWTVEMQRANNDKYWASGGTAFWLNPNMYRDGAFNMAAEACPAPDWWTAPDWKPKYIPLDYNKVLDEAMLAPVVGAKGETGPNFNDLFVKATPEQIEQKLQEKMDDFNSEYDFQIGETDEEWAKGKYASPVDQVIDYLEKLNGDEHYDYNDWKEEYEVDRFGKNRGPKKVSPVRNMQSNAGAPFVMVEFNGEVRGFETKDEADRWLQLAQKSARIVSQETVRNKTPREIELEKQYEAKIQAEHRAMSEKLRREAEMARKQTDAAADILRRIREKSRQV